MGDVNRILITGATGFIGQATVADARARGLPVTVVARNKVPKAWRTDDGITVVQADLSDPGCVDDLRDALHGVGVVIHAAAHLGDDPRAVASDTVRGTDHLLQAMQDSAARLVLVSSIVVYDTMRLSPGDMLTEDSPLETVQHARDAYAEGKLRQEALVRDAGRDAWLIRPGAVWGPGRTWHALMGFWASKLFVQIGGDGELPLVHVDHLARMLIDAALQDPGGLRALNALDDDRPTRARFMAAHRRMTGWPRMVLPVPYPTWLALARALRPFAEKLPGLFREPILRARLMPLHYPNTALRSALGGEDNDTFEGMLARSMERQT